MLYIDDVGNESVRFGDAVGGGDVQKTLPNNLVARSSESVGNDTTGRVWVSDKDTGAVILDVFNPALITLDGVIYPAAGNFVQAFNAMIAGETLVTVYVSSSILFNLISAISF